MFFTGRLKQYRKNYGNYVRGCAGLGSMEMEPGSDWDPSRHGLLPHHFLFF